MVLTGIEEYANAKKYFELRDARQGVTANDSISGPINTLFNQ